MKNKITLLTISALLLSLKAFGAAQEVAADVDPAEQQNARQAYARAAKLVIVGDEMRAFTALHTLPSPKRGLSPEPQKSAKERFYWLCQNPDGEIDKKAAEDMLIVNGKIYKESLFNEIDEGGVTFLVLKPELIQVKDAEILREHHETLLSILKGVVNKEEETGFFADWF